MTPDSITIEDLNAMSDEEFVALFSGAAAFLGLITALGQQAIQETAEAAS